ncbi:hypothetical protein LSAT2_005270 [Lamellibrachia satsuma]|nr:hypothetical protein LSAT2_005270 [Lamellibrachia satsuma]
MKTVRSVLVATASLSAAANVILNSLVMVVIARTLKLREDRTTLFVFSLAASDLAFGICTMGTSAIICSHPEIRIDEFMSVFSTLGAWLYLTSLYNMCSVSLCKMVAVVYPMRYLALVTERRCYLVIFINWTGSFLLTIPIYFIDLPWSQEMCFVRLQKSSGNKLAYVFASQFVGGVLPIVVMTYANVRMFMVVVHAIHRVSAEGLQLGEGTNTTVLQQHTLAMSVLRSVRSSINIIIICSLYISVLLIEIIVEISVALRETQTPSVAEIIVVWLVFNNTSINSLLYIVLHRSVRTALKNLLHQ